MPWIVTGEIVVYRYRGPSIDPSNQRVWPFADSLRKNASGDINQAKCQIGNYLEQLEIFIYLSVSINKIWDSFWLKLRPDYYRLRVSKIDVTANSLVCYYGMRGFQLHKKWAGFIHRNFIVIYELRDRIYWHIYFVLNECWIIWLC